MTEAVYKVLDIRECQTISKATYWVPYGRTGQIDLEYQHFIVAICINIADGTRKRFEFYPKRFVGNSTLGTAYLGYSGDYTLLVPGDLFEIKSTSKWPEVCIVTEERNYED